MKLGTAFAIIGIWGGAAAMCFACREGVVLIGLVAMVATMFVAEASD